MQRQFERDGVTYNVTDHSDGGISDADIENILDNLHTTEAYKEEVSNDLASSGGDDAIVDIHIDHPDRRSTGTFDDANNNNRPSINVKTEQFLDDYQNTYAGENGENIQNDVDSALAHEIAHLHQERIGEDDDGDGIPDPHDGVDGNPAMGEEQYAEQEDYAREKTNKIREELGLPKRKSDYARASGDMDGDGDIDSDDDEILMDAQLPGLNPNNPEDLNADNIVDENDDRAQEVIEETIRKGDGTGVTTVIDPDGVSGAGQPTILPNERYNPPPEGLPPIPETSRPPPPKPDPWWYDFLPDWLKAFLKGSPLTLDLDGDGIELISIHDSNVRWDIDVDGFAELSGWVSADDGLLALDINGDGFINDNSELFGTADIDGFTVLAQYDLNGDDVINSVDDVYDNLLVWQDINQNGISEATELYTLAELDITRINLNASTPSGLSIEGNEISHVSNYTVDDGINSPQTYDIVDAWFQYDNADTQYIDDYDLDIVTLFLPLLRGYGDLPHLTIAASIDNDRLDTDSLINLLKNINLQSLDQIFASNTSVESDIRNILYRWAGVDDVLGARGAMDAQELAFLEKLTGEPFLRLGFDPNPGRDASIDLQNAFATAYNAMYARLLIQTDAAEIFIGDAEYSFYSDGITGITGLDHTKIAELEVEAIASVDKTEYWQNVVRLIEFSVGTTNLDAADITALNDSIAASDASLDLNDVLNSLGFEGYVGVDLTADNSGETLIGGVGEDTLTGGTGNDNLDGLAGHDVLHGGDGADILTGGAGTDFLLGGKGNDTYVFNVGEAADTIQEVDGRIGTDTILFGAGITLADLTFTRPTNDDLLITISETAGGGYIAIENSFNNDLVESANGFVETIEFNDGSTFDLGSLDHTLIDTQGNVNTVHFLNGVQSGGGDNDTIYGGLAHDYISGYEGHDYLDGGAGNDLLDGSFGNDHLVGGVGDDDLYGQDGSDILNAGAGNDTLRGGILNDTYIYTSGDDIIDELGVTGGGANDVLVLPDGIAFEDLTFQVGGNYTLEMKVGDLGSITISQQFNQGQSVGTNPNIETLRFSDGSEHVFADHGLTQIGTNENDILFGTLANTNGNDIVYGLDGDDKYFESFALSGDDTFSGGLGNDEFIGGFGFDTALFAGEFAGYAIDDTNSNDIYVTDTNLTDGINEGTDRLLQVEKLIFADGTYEAGVFTEFPDPTILSFITTDFSGYAGEDLSSGETLHDGGREIQLVGNTWTKADFDYTVTEDTILSFEYYLNTMKEGEIHSIGVDFDDNFNNDNEVLFKLDGTQSSSILNYDYNNGYSGEGGEFVQYNIRLGDYITGDVNYLTFANDHDVATPDAESAYKNIRVFEKDHEFITLDATAFGEYSQDQDGHNFDETVSSDGLIYTMDGNAWRTAHYDYTVTENTVLEFEFSSTLAGEIHALGVDNDLFFNNNDEHFFTLGSSQSTVFNNDFRGYEVGDGTVKYTIRLGDYHTGDINYLTFINNDDARDIENAPAGTEFGNSIFSNLRLYEADHDYLLISETNLREYSTLSRELEKGEVNKVITDDALSITFGVDTWQRMLHSYTVTADTVLEFDFSSDVEGAIHAIGIDTDNFFGSSDIDFFLSGTSGSTIFNRDVDQYDDGGESVHYTINLGEHFTGDIDYLTFINASDNSDSTFSNLRLYDASGTAETVDGTGSILTGSAGDDVLIGLGSDDALEGQAGDDKLVGANGADTLNGGADDDILYGQDGLDTLIGGLGADTFVFEAGSAFNDVDVISDFDTAEGDILDLSALLSGYDAVQDAITDFIQITDNGIDTVVSVDADGGADAFLQIATLTGVTGLTDENALETSGNLITV